MAQKIHIEEYELIQNLLIQDLLLESGSRGDEVTGEIISEIAAIVLDQCVVGQSKGGSVRDFSKVLS